MNICFLGTSSGTPTKNRNVSAIAVVESQGNDWYLVDCGEGTQHQLLNSRLSLNNLQVICITHIHGDHCYGLPGLLASAGMNGRKNPLTIIAPQGIKEWFEATQQFTQLYLPYELTFIAVESFTVFTTGQFKISATELSHRVPSFAYSFQEAKTNTSLDIAKLKSHGIPQGPLWGQIQSGNDIECEGKCYKSADFLKYENSPRKIIVCGDNDKPELLAGECLNCNVLIHEATYTEDMASKVGDVGHSYARQVASFANAHALPSLILTHFSPRYQSDPKTSPSIDDIRKEATNVYSGALYLAADFQTYQLDKSGHLTLERAE